jgi:hypothetical protein
MAFSSTTWPLSTGERRLWSTRLLVTTWNAAGLPVGVQIVAAPWREDLLLQVSYTLELALRDCIPQLAGAPFADSQTDRLGGHATELSHLKPGGISKLKECNK